MLKVPHNFQQIAIMLGFFSACINVPIFKEYGLKHFKSTATDQTDLENQFDGFIKWLIKTGLAEKHPLENDFIRLHSLYKNQLALESLDQSALAKYREVFILYYINYANAINILLQTKQIDQHLLGKKWAALEFENLFASHLLTLQQYRTTSSFYALSTFLQIQQQWTKLFKLCQLTFKSMNQYPQAYQDLDYFHQKEVLFNALGTYWEEQKKPFKAKEYYEEIIKIYTQLDQEYTEGKLYGTIVYQGKKRKGEIYINLGIIAFNEHQLQDAITLYRKAEGIFKTLNDQENLARVYNLLATTYNEQKNFKESNQVFIKVINLLNEAEEKNQEQIANVTHNYALHLIETGDIQHVEFYLQECIKIFSNYNNEDQVSGVYLTLGNFYIEKGDFQKALIAFKKSLNLFIKLNNQTKQAVIFQNMGWVSAQLEEWDDAESYFLRALKLTSKLQDKSKAAELNHNLGNLYYNRGEWEKAEHHFLNALPIYKNYHYTSNEAIVFKTLGMLYLEIKKYEKSDKAFQNALSFFSTQSETIDHAECLFYAGMATSKLEHWQKSENYLKKAYSFYSKENNTRREAQSLFELGMVEFALKKDKKALKNLNNAYLLFERLQMTKEKDTTLKLIHKIQNFLL